MPLRVAVIGDAVLDVHVSGATPIGGADVPAAVRLEPGGQGANLAVRLARRGAHVRLACALADDAAGRLLRERLAGEGVEPVAVVAVDTGAVVVLVAPDGERSMLSQRVPIAPGLGAERLVAVAADVDWVAVSGYLLLEPGALVLASSLAGTPARRVVLGCAFGPADASRWRAAVAACRPSLLVLNGAEAAALSGTPEATDAADRLAGELGAAVVVTHPGGAVAVVGNRRLAAAARTAEAPLDTTGAGDAFTAALLAALGTGPLDARTLEPALSGAVEAGTAATRVIGAQGGLPGERDPDTLGR